MYNNYIKHTYFVTEEGLRNFKRKAKEQRISLVKAKSKACEILHPRVQAGFAAPKVWTRDCPRQGAWYRQSPESGKYLVVSAIPLDETGAGISLTMSDFSPPVMPTSGEMQELVQARDYQAVKPGEWEHITEEDRLKFAMGRATIKRTLGVVPACESESFDQVFISHCANHSNFISPRYYVKEGEQVCPYSIGDTFHVCSACLELFNLVGTQHRVKYVVPCPGAVTTAELPIHRYIRAERMD